MLCLDLTSLWRKVKSGGYLFAHRARSCYVSQFYMNKCHSHSRQFDVIWNCLSTMRNKYLDRAS